MSSENPIPKLNELSIVPFEFSLTSLLYDAPLTVLKQPPTKILPSLCNFKQFTAVLPELLKIGTGNESSVVPSEFNLTKQIILPPAPLKTPPTNIFPSGNGKTQFTE